MRGKIALMSGLLGSLGNALQPTGDVLGSTVGSLTNSVDQTVGTVKSTGNSIGSSANGVLGDVGIDQARGPFQQCIAQALSGDSARFAFPQDLLFDLTDLQLYNLDHPVTPEAIVYPNNVHEVSAVVACATQYGVAVQGRSGGHSYDNNGLGGVNGSLSVNFRNMNHFSYDKQSETVTFGPGNLLRDLDRQLALIDRVMVYGVVGEIGTGGHITIGGLGALSRLLGTATDQVLSVQAVLADGSIVKASNDENPDLFFAIRGAAWSFALVTEFTMQTSPAPSQVISYQYNITVAPGSATILADTFKSWQKFITNPDLTRRFASTLTLSNDILIFSGTYFGDQESFNQLNIEADVLGVAADLGITSRVVTTVVHELFHLVTDVFGSIPMHFYSKSLKVKPHCTWSDAAIDQVFQYIEKTDKGTPVWFVVWNLDGGYVSDIPQTATAYWHRDVIYFMQSYVVDLVGPVSQTSYSFLNGLNSLIQQLVPGTDESAYPGYVDDQLHDYLTAYWGGNVERLVKVKGKYDPKNTFRNPQSVPLSYGAGKRDTEEKREADYEGQPVNPPHRGDPRHGGKRNADYEGQPVNPPHRGDPRHGGKRNADYKGQPVNPPHRGDPRHGGKRDLEEREADYEGQPVNPPHRGDPRHGGGKEKRDAENNDQPVNPPHRGDPRHGGKRDLPGHNHGKRTWQNPLEPLGGIVKEKREAVYQGQPVNPYTRGCLVIDLCRTPP